MCIQKMQSLTGIWRWRQRRRNNDSHISQEQSIRQAPYKFRHLFCELAAAGIHRITYL